MAAPAINSVTFDKPTGYNVGDTVKATVAFTPGTTPKTYTLTITAVDSASSAQGTGTGSFTVNQPDATTISGSDTGNHTWAVSVSGNTATLTASNVS